MEKSRGSSGTVWGHGLDPPPVCQQRSPPFCTLLNVKTLGKRDFACLRQGSEILFLVCLGHKGCEVGAE